MGQFVQGCLEATKLTLRMLVARLVDSTCAVVTHVVLPEAASDRYVDRIKQELIEARLTNVEMGCSSHMAYVVSEAWVEACAQLGAKAAEASFILPQSARAAQLAMQSCDC